jgi:hypothetical protein
MLRQLAAAPFEISGGDIVIGQHAKQDVIIERRIYQPKSTDYMTAQTTNIRSFQQVQLESGQSSV